MLAVFFVIKITIISILDYFVILFRESVTSLWWQSSSGNLIIPLQLLYEFVNIGSTHIEFSGLLKNVGSFISFEIHRLYNSQNSLRKKFWSSALSIRICDRILPIKDLTFFQCYSRDGKQCSNEDYKCTIRAFSFSLNLVLWKIHLLSNS